MSLAFRSLNLFGLCLLVLAATACNQQTDDRATTATTTTKPAISTDKLLADITRLASDEFGGRAPMSSGETLSLNFIEQRFRDLNLDPLFGDSYRQAVPLVAIITHPNAQMTISASGDETAEPLVLNYAEDIMLWSQRPGQQIAIDASEIVFVGYGVVAPEYNWDDYAGLDVAGKTVIILINDPGFASNDNQLFEGRAMTYYGRWSYKLEEAARQGASAALIVHNTEPASYPWAVVSNSWSGPQFHLDLDGNINDVLPIEGWLTYQAAAQIMQLGGHNLADLEVAALTPGFQPVALPLTATSRVEQTIERAESYNVGAKITGSASPDDWFIYMAHWDHIGRGIPQEGIDTIYNGAVDNATGVAGILALAEAFASQPQTPERTIALLAVTAEESGLLGSAHYARNPPLPMSRHVAGINMDAMNVYGPTSDLVVIGYGKSQMEDYLRKHAEEQQRVVAPEEHPEAGLFYRSDHFNFAKQGVPVLYAESGNHHIEHGTAWMIQKQKEFNANRYHKAADEVLEDWDLTGMQQDLELFFQIGWDLTNNSDWPEWYAGNEFKAIREQSLQ